MINRRKILFVTERRADFGRLKPLLRGVQKSRRLTPLLVVTGTHLLKKFGYTKNEIIAGGFHIDATLSIFNENDPDTGSMMARAFGKAVIGMSDIFQRLKPDIVVVPFDLGASLAAAIAAMHLNISVAHIEGGEVSGTIDEVFRHALTKFSHLHFAASKESRQRIIKLGENPHYVFNVGSLGLNVIRGINYPSKKAVFDKFNLIPSRRLIVFLQHPVTTEEQEVVKQIEESIAALKAAIEKYRAQVIAIYGNSDTGGRRMIARLRQSGMTTYSHIGSEDFLRLLKFADVLMGNSSAGIQEAPSFGLPVVNIGTRQQFRERGVNVIDVPYSRSAIFAAIRKAFLDKKFLKRVKSGKNPYDNGDSTSKIVSILENIKIPHIQKVITY